MGKRIFQSAEKFKQERAGLIILDNVSSIAQMF